jgi:hypothetical protein
VIRAHAAARSSPVGVSGTAVVFSPWTLDLDAIGMFGRPVAAASVHELSVMLPWTVPLPEDASAPSGA